MDLPQLPSRLFGRRTGRPLRVRKSRLVEELLPTLLIDGSRGIVTLEELFPHADPLHLWMEIGFGGGEHLARQALLHPDVSFIGCEPFLNGVASLLDHLDQNQTGNVRIYNDDARTMLDALPDASLEKCFVLFADPWPKKRHVERRFIGEDNLERLARTLKPNALLRLASDHPVLIAWMRDVLRGHKAFTSIYDSPVPPKDWVSTRYQDKALRAGREPIFMDYRRNAET